MFTKFDLLQTQDQIELGDEGPLTVNDHRAGNAVAITLSQGKVPAWRLFSTSCKMPP